MSYVVYNSTNKYWWNYCSKSINNLPTKNSCGYDDISSKLWTVIAPVIIKPLTLLINQGLNTGIFADKLKIAKVIPIYKKGDPQLFENYRPISLLPTISKVLEKIIHKQLLSYFEEYGLFSLTSMALDLNIPMNMQRSNW